MALGIAAPSLALSAQVAPDHHWLTLSTRHFNVHFTAETESVARRAAASAEVAYTQLSRELHPPRGPIELVISDDADQSNGSATPFPTNRIIIYANPPVGESSLRFTDDWTAMVVTHELTHIFHLDRSRGIWRLGQGVFGRSPYLFPNEYAPSWLTEGLAVYYESRLTGAGRITGSEHRMIARASAISRRFPALSQVSLASPNFPFGEAAYAYGSLFVDFIARTRGPETVGRFVEKSSADILPFYIDLPARQAFGVSFQRAYRDWRDTLMRGTAGLGDPTRPLPAWRDLTGDELFAAFPRWVNGGALVYTGSPGREFYSAWRVDTLGRRTSAGRRNSGSPQVALAEGGLLFSQLDFTTPYTLRSDLYVDDGHRQRRLTRGARLSMPDARADGAIVAVETAPGATRLVRVSSTGAVVAVLAPGSLDALWTEPRWSHAGDRIAAVRWRRGGISEVVILDTLGAIQRVIASGHAVQATPSWTIDDAGVLYSSDRTGVAQVYRASVADGSERVVSRAVTGLFEPTPGRSGTLAAVLFRADGYHLGVGRCCDAAPDEAAAPIAQAGAVPTPPVAIDTTPARPFSPWGYLVPRYWTPSYGSGMHAGQPRIGAETSARDPVGRHAWAASIAIPTDNSGIIGGVAYSYAGLGLPIIDASFSQDWSLSALVSDNTTQQNIIGEIRRRTEDGQLLGSWIRQRVRSALSFTTGAGVEQYSFASAPGGLIPSVDTVGTFDTRWYPRLIAAARYARTRTAPYSISPEDGFTVAATARERWRTDNAKGSASLSLVGVATGYKSLNLPGFAHHVLALRAAAGARDARSTGYLEVGGTSGTPVEIIAGYTVGEGRRDFGVRGFEGGSLLGTRAVAGSAEYRIPLVKPGRGVGPLPVFFERSSLTLFGDYGSAWCATVTSNLVCTPNVVSRYDLATHRALASVGAELNVNAAVLSWDDPYRFRLGIAHPVRDDGLFERARTVSMYFAAGLAF